MVKIIQQNNKELYQCEECGFHYKDREWAEKFESANKAAAGGGAERVDFFRNFA